MVYDMNIFWENIQSFISTSFFQYIEYFNKHVSFGSELAVDPIPEIHLKFVGFVVRWLAEPPETGPHVGPLTQSNSH